MSDRTSEHCYNCGASAVYVGALPHCPEHGPLWLLRRNAPSASAIIVRDREILLSRRAREPWKGCWETPGGYIDEAEHPEAAVRREVREELGLVVANVRLFDVFVDEWAPGQWVQNTVYVVSPGDTDVRPDPREVVEWAWFSIDDLPSPMASTEAERIIAWRKTLGAAGGPVSQTG